MCWRPICVVALACIFCYSAAASAVSGKITVENKLTKKNVAGAIYDLRGIAIPETQSGHGSSNEFERVAVWLEGPNLSKPSPVTVKLQQRNKRFEPDLLVIPIGSTVEFPNLDPMFHNIFSLSRTQSFDLGYYAKGRSRSVSFPRAGVVQVYCHVHPEMHAVIIVTSSPWSGKPRQDGTFSWADISPGNYKLYVWQRSVGLIHRTVSVPQTGDVFLNIALPEESDN
jgi:plastocyanin